MNIEMKKIITEFPQIKENKLKGISCHEILIPDFVIYPDIPSCEKRVALYCYLMIHKGMDNVVRFNIPDYVRWLGFKPKYGRGGINEKSRSELLSMEDYGLVSLKKISDNLFDVTVREDEIEKKKNYAVVYLDEVEKIMRAPIEVTQVRTDTNIWNSYKVLTVFAYLRMLIRTRKNFVEVEKNDITSTEALLTKYKKSLPEAYDTTYKIIAEELGYGQTKVGQFVLILDRLGLIKYFRPYVIKHDDGSYFTNNQIFVNYYKRFNGYLLAAGENYYLAEAKNKEAALKRREGRYQIDYNRK